MKKSRRRSRILLKDLVRQRVQILYQIAVEEARHGNLEYAARLGNLIREISLGTGVRLPRHIKRGLCKHCGLPLIPGLTAEVRLKSQGGFSYKVIRCAKCGWIHRIPYKKGVSTHVSRATEKG